ncbi:chitinase [Aureibacter tunicatorum]|uniref:Glycoside hydrolase family 19 catalytic domain-containing protein n=1 Tax=Aureibacter tunicatorum TaxID=866807 RepID=A0AAE3XIL0_9BACT|nr:chitinase [Aureibacter tunicatorum]MDR6237378.1 hypothetical protein [Aureibacter tunicatorum]BDD06368.1 hypothetical protein AUTU_38510 [Aureibacter tunicatorum]
MKFKNISLLVFLSLGVLMYSCSEDGENDIIENPNPGDPTDPDNPDNPDNPDPGDGELPNTTIGDLISKEEYEEFFPYRYGAEQSNNWEINPEKDFFVYEALIKAAAGLENIMLKIESRVITDTYSAQRITRIDKQTGEEKLLKEEDDFNAEWNQSKPIVTTEVDYANFLNQGTETQRSQELAAFLANISHETTGGWPTAPGGQYAWGLHFREEVGYENGGAISYRDETNKYYPPAPGQSYHGRGPIQLSWNYNYGQFSDFLYGDKNVLLDDPGKLTKDAIISFQSAIWFWMTPQFPKPSCHDVMVGNWEPSQEDLSAGRKPGFGMTINIINGGIECGHGTNDKIKSRNGFYERYTSIFGVPMGDDCDCGGMQSY